MDISRRELKGLTQAGCGLTEVRVAGRYEVFKPNCYIVAGPLASIKIILSSTVVSYHALGLIKVNKHFW